MSLTPQAHPGRAHGGDRGARVQNGKLPVFLKPWLASHHCHPACQANHMAESWWEGPRRRCVPEHATGRGKAPTETAESSR